MDDITGCGDVRVGGWTQTFSGRQFWPLDPQPEDVSILDIAHHLAGSCRYGRAAEPFYSVAQHSVYVSRLVPPGVALWGLLHDAPEAWLDDTPRPIKTELQRRAEDRVMAAVAIRFGLDGLMPAAVKEVDDRILADERRVVMAPEPAPWDHDPEPLGVVIEPVGPREAELLFLRRFLELTEGGPGDQFDIGRNGPRPKASDAS